MKVYCVACIFNTSIVGLALVNLISREGVEVEKEGVEVRDLIWLPARRLQHLNVSTGV